MGKLSISELERREKKLLEKLKEIRERKLQHIKEARRNRILSDAIKFYPQFSFWRALIRSRTNKQPVSRYAPKTLTMAILLYRCNRGKAVHDVRSCLKRLLKELEEAQAVFDELHLPLGLRDLAELVEADIDFQELYRKMKGKQVEEKLRLILETLEEELRSI